MSSNNSVFTNIVDNQADNRIRRYNRVLKGINRIFSNVVQAKTEEELGNACLSVALEITGSQFGFVGEIGADGLLHDIAISDMGWKQCLMYDKIGHRRPPGDFVLHGLYGRVIDSRKGFFTNDPPSHPDSIGLPPGHPSLTSFLGVPLIQEGIAVGMIAVANREGGYSCEQQEDLEAIAPAVTQALQRKRSEESLRVSNHYNRSLIEASLDPSVTIGRDGKITDVNGATEQVTGYSRRKLIGTDFSDYFTEPERAHKGYQQVFRDGEVRDYPLEIKHKDGHITPVLYHASVYRDKNGEVIGVFAVARDITAIKRAEEKIQILANAIESSEDAIITKSLDDIITNWNKGAEQVYGYSAEEVLGKSISILEPDNTKGEIKHLIEKIKQGEKVQHYETLRMKKDGTIINISVTLSPVFDASGKLVAISTIARDITERKKAEEALSRERSLLESVMQATDVMLVLLDPQFNFLWVNSAYAETCQLKPEEMVGKNHFALYPDAENEAIFRRVRDTGKGVFYKDKPFAFPDQPERGVTYWDWSLAPVKNSCGDVEGLVFSLRETTKYKQVEEALQKSEAELAKAQKISKIGSWTWDLITNEVTWSEQSYLNYGLAPGEVKPSYELFLSFIVPEDRERVDREVKKAIESSHKYNVTYNIIRVDGTPRILLSENEIVKDESGKVVLMYGINQDITEQKRAEEALKKARDTLEEKVKERTAELQEAYNSLKESETGLTEAQKMANIGNWEWDTATDKAYWSEEMYRIFRRNSQELAPPYNEFLNYVHPDDRDYVDSTLKKAVKGKTHSIEYRIFLANGEERAVYMQSEVVFDEINTPIRAKGIIQDITERKRTEEKIQTLASAVESSSDAIITVSLGGTITSWNKAAEQVYGYSAQEVIGKSVSILAPSHLREETKKLTEMVIQGEKVHQYETLRLRKDDTIINVSITLSPVFDTTGKLVAISGIVRDVTERIKAEEALRESEARMRLFYESDMLGVCYYKLDGLITDSNDRFLEIVGYTREDLQAGKVNWKKMTPPEYHSLDEQSIAELKTTGLKGPKEKEYIRKDGSRVPVNVGAATFDKVCNGGTAFVLDITERKRAEEALANLEIARKKEIHHRIKNNLQVISSLLDLQADKFDNPKVIEAFRESQNRVISMALIHEELYKGEGTDTLDFSTYIGELAENLFQTYSLSNKNIHLSMDLEEDLLFDMDTAVPLGIIINELVSNSLKHAFTGRYKGEIRIKLHREGGECKKEDNKSTSFVLTVSDNGVGIPEDLEIEDLGSLGLQLVTTLVDQLDGYLELKRKNGTEFTMRFTVTEKDSLAQSA